MDRSEHLLACLAEEAGEIVQAVGKALRFGLQDGYPGTDRTNEKDIQIECAQLLAVLEMLEQEVFKDKDIGELQRVVEQKKMKVINYIEHAKQVGALNAKE